MYFSLPRLLILTTLIAFATPLTAQTVCGKYDNVAVSNSYRIMTNRFNSDNPMCLSANGPSYSVTQGSFNVPTDGAPAAYPAIYKGCHWGTCTADASLPVQLSTIGAVTSSIAITPATGTWDAAYDIWFNKAASTSGQPDGAEIMLWINHQGPIQPAGSRVGTVTLGGLTWDVWIGNFGWNVVSYVLTSPTTSANLDLKPFFADALSRGQLQSAWWLIAVEAGFEIWSGGQGLAVNTFGVGLGSASGGNSGTASSTPIITSVTPSSTNPGTQVTILGGPFGPSQGSSAVSFGGNFAQILSWSDTSITALVPSMPGGITSLAVLVASPSVAFTVRSTITYVNGYPTVNGNYVDCNGNIDNDPAHHSTNSSDTDPAHHVGQNCPAGSWVATH